MKIWAYIVGGIAVGFLASLIPNTMLSLYFLNNYPQMDFSPWGGAITLAGVVIGLLVAHRMYKRSN